MCYNRIRGSDFGAYLIIKFKIFDSVYDLSEAKGRYPVGILQEIRRKIIMCEKKCYNKNTMMGLHCRIRKRIQNTVCVMAVILFGVFLSFSFFGQNNVVYAEDVGAEGEAHFVTIYDSGTEMTVKTSARTVAEVLERVDVAVDDGDIVEPAVNSEVSNDNFRINIYRARPVLVIDGLQQRYLMTASYDPEQIAREAGFTVYDGDEISTKQNQNFLEAGALSTFEIERKGGRTITVEEAIPYTVETKPDASMAKGETKLEQAGEDGKKVTTYVVEFENNVEVKRTLVGEEVVREPVPEINLIGAKASVAPGQETCASWVREAGVSEEDLDAALTLIYHESGCRVDAANPSGAYGIPQALPGSKMASAGADWETNPVTQIRWMSSYVNRYGGWQGAMAWWWEHHWY